MHQFFNFLKLKNNKKALFIGCALVFTFSLSILYVSAQSDDAGGSSDTDGGGTAAGGGPGTGAGGCGCGPGTGGSWGDTMSPPDCPNRGGGSCDSCGDVTGGGGAPGTPSTPPFTMNVTASCVGTELQPKIVADYDNVSCTDRINIYYNGTLIDRNGCGTAPAVTFYEFRHDVVTPVGLLPGNYSVRLEEVSGGAVVSSVTQNVSVPQCSFIDLASSGVSLQGGGTSMSLGADVRFEAQVRNGGNIQAGTFKDRFSYSYSGASGFFTPISPDAVHLSLGAGASQGDVSGTFRPLTPGTITIKHCVDEFFEVSESNESNNCSTRDFIVTSDVTVASCSVTSPAVVGDPVTWTATASGGSGSYVFLWNSIDGPSGSGNPKTVTYTTPGVKYASVEAIDVSDATRRSGIVSCDVLGTRSTVTPSSDPTADLWIRLLGSSSWTSGPLNITSGDNVELKWSSANADSCTATAYFNTGGAVSGETSGVGGVLEPASGNRRYEVTCSRGGRSATDFVDVVVVASGPGSPPTITADPTRVRQGDDTSIRGTLNGHSGCVIRGNNIDPTNSDGDSDPHTQIIPGSGSYGPYTTGPIVGTTPYTLSCGSGGSASVTVRVNPLYEEY